MLDATQGWGVDPGAILKTSDGGATWTNVTPSDPPPHATFQGGFFLDAKTGWVSYNDPGVLGGGVLHTTNGGATWSDAVVAPPSAGGFFLGDAIDFINPLIGWLMVGGGGAAGSERVEIYHTTDGGDTWTSLSPPTRQGAPVPGSLPDAGSKNGMVFVNAKDGWISAYGHPYLYATTDGGIHWVQSPLPPPPNIDWAKSQLKAGPLRFFGHGEGMLVVAGSFGAVLYATEDSGATWHVQATVPDPFLAAWAFVSPSTGWAWNMNVPKIVATDDGGRTWTTTALPGAGGNVDLAFVSAADGFAWTGTIGVHDPSLWRTTDGARSWMKVSPRLTVTNGGA